MKGRIDTSAAIKEDCIQSFFDGAAEKGGCPDTRWWPWDVEQKSSALEI